MTLNFKVFTLNCWGLALVSKNRKQRILAIAELLAGAQFDVACFQEVWTNRDFKILRDKLVNVLPYSHYFHSGVTGSGICILSKHSIEETFYHQWSVNGYIHKLHHGDWWGGKGVGLCRLRVKAPNSETYYVNVYSTHLHAEYNRTSDDYKAHRVLQAYDTAQFIMLTSGSADLVVLAGDLNTTPEDLAYKVILTVPGLIDACTKFNNVPEDKLCTFGNASNSYTPTSSLTKEVGQRIDYIMYHPGSNFTVDLKNYSFPLPCRVPKQQFSYSDHEALLVELTLTKDKKSTRNCPDEAAKHAVLEECLELCDEALSSISKTKLFYWLGVTILFILLLLSLVLPAVIIVFDKYPALVAVLRVILTIVLVFCLLMATMWSRIEMHGVLSGKLAMEVSMRVIEEHNCHNH